MHSQEWRQDVLGLWNQGRSQTVRDQCTQEEQDADKPKSEWSCFWKMTAIRNTWKKEVEWFYFFGG